MVHLFINRVHLFNIDPHSYFCNLDTADKNELAVIINYEIIPLLKEYWFDDRKKVDQWSAKLQGALND